MSLQPINTNTSELVFSRYHSSLNADVASGSGTITIYSISQFAINKVLLIGEYGSEGSEIIKTHTATAPTGNTVTLVSNTVKAHSKDTPVYILAFDQIEFSHADTATGSKSVLGSVLDIDPKEDEMTYDDTTNTSGYYFTRYKNSITSVYSNYSDGIPYSGMPDNTVGYAIDTAMNELNARFTDRLTFTMMIGFAKQMLHLIRGKRKSWGNYKEIDYNVGTVSQGVRSYAMPSTAYNQNTNKSILSLRVGNALPLTYIDRAEYLQVTEDTSYTEVATEGAVGATSLVLDDTSDLDSTGSVYVYVSGTRYTINYTVNTKSTNTLTIASDQITATLPVNSQVWQGIEDVEEVEGVEEDEPEFYSVWDGYIYLWPMISSIYEGENLTADFLTEIEDIDSQMDVLTSRYSNMLLPFLKWKLRAVVENSGKEDMRDSNYIEFREILNDAIRMESPSAIVAFRPRKKAIFGGRAHDNKR